MRTGRRDLATVALPLYVALVLLVTLAPVGGEGAAWRTCVACGERGVADALLNVLLFVPIGLGVRSRGGSWARAALAGLVLSAGIEAIQGFVPGRFGNLGDVLANGAGGALGAALPALRARWRNAAGRPTGLAALVVGGAAGALALATGWVAAPAPPGGWYFVFWTPDLGHLAPTDARVLRATLSGRSRPHGWVTDPERARRDLGDGPDLELVFEPGRPPDGLAGLFAVHDHRQREALLVGRDGDDLVLRWRRRAAGLRLGQPDLRLGGFFAGLAGRDTVFLSVASSPGAGTGSGGGTCLRRTIEGGRGSTGRTDARCGLGLTVGRGWEFLLPVSPGTGARRLLDVAWVCLIGVAVGLAWVPRPAAWIGALLPLAGLVAAPLSTTLLPTPPSQYGAAAVGIVGAALWRRRASRLRAPSAGQSGEPTIASAADSQQASIRS